MAEKIIKGVLIKKQNYQDVDQIVTFLTSHGLETMMALGTRKILSKNRIALELGNYIEIEYFKARLKNKISKLKKANLIKQINLQVSDNAKVVLKIIKLINKYKDVGKNVYKTFINLYEYWDEEYNHHILSLIKFSLLKDLGINPIMKYCVDCYSFKNINSFSLHRGGFLCLKHTKIKTSLYELKSWKKLDEGIIKYKNVNHETNFKINNMIDEYLNNVSF